MRRHFLLLLSVSFLELIRASNQQVQMTRTSLHVARSLDPEATETMTVRTRTGDVATLIVKKREERGRSLLIPPEAEIKRSRATVQEEKKDLERISVADVKSKIKSVRSAESPIDLKPEESTVSPLPAPVVINSSFVLVKETPNATKKPAADQTRDGRRLQIDSDGIPIIHGIRVPDDESDKQVWRNARVINGILVPYDKNKKYPYNSTKITSSYDWPKIKKPVTQTLHTSTVKVTLPQPGNVWQKWRPGANDRLAVVGSGPVSSAGNNFMFKTDPDFMHQNWQKVDSSKPSSPKEKYKQHPSGLWIREDETTTNYEEKYVTDKIIDYIRNINKQEMYNQNSNHKKFTLRDARMVNDVPEKKPGIQSRVLHNPGNSIYPNSLLYSPSTSKPSRVSFEEGVRTPVLQYAHPELGVQSAKTTTSNDDMLLKADGRREQALAYFAHDIHADRSPFAFEPGLEEEAKVELPETAGVSIKKGRDTSGVLSRPKKTLSYFYENQAVNPYPEINYNKYNNKGGMNYKINGYHTSYYAPAASENRPFWERLSESFKEQMQTGIDRVSDLTRPVVEPLVEATHKISQNLGLNSGAKELSSFKEKLGVAGSPSVLLPALGLVAGGAALGLGAVAVGRTTMDGTEVVEM